MIRMLVIATGTVTTIVGSNKRGRESGVGTAAQFSGPEGVTLSLDGRVALVTDTFNDTIRRIDLATGDVTTLAGYAGPGFRDGDAATARFSEPTGIALSADNRIALVSDTTNQWIRKIVFTDLLTNSGKKIQPAPPPTPPVQSQPKSLILDSLAATDKLTSAVRTVIYTETAIITSTEAITAIPQKVVLIIP